MAILVTVMILFGRKMDLMFDIVEFVDVLHIERKKKCENHIAVSIVDGLSSYHFQVYCLLCDPIITMCNLMHCNYILGYGTQEQM